MASKTVKVGSSVGLHARPAAIVAEKAGEFDEEITLATAEEGPIDASSMMLIMTLKKRRLTKQTKTKLIFS